MHLYVCTLKLKFLEFEIQDGEKKSKNHVISSTI